ncbi:MAG: hybrid sensor histidine kinase/response regulator [Sphingobacteriales bacterium]|nr:MAG: hybrid sensor histidine kinase/response regulator [Sphingobacteriales bacterium]
MSKNVKVLYVDDEINNLSSFKASFRFDYKILIAQTTTEAFTYLSQHPDIHVILCDQRMPVKTGVDFLEQVRKQYPKPVRMLITGYTDVESVIDAINRGNIFRYIKKPWTEDYIRAAIEEGYKFHMTNSLLSVKNEELQQAYAALDEFSYSVTHGLRDPILSVVSLVEIAKNVDDMPPDAAELIEMIGQAMLQLDSFIENTHDHHRLKRGEIEFKEVWMTDIIKNVQDIYEIEATVNNINFTTSVDQKEAIISSEILLNLIINNLLSNAFKYYNRDSEDRQVELKVSVDKKNLTILVKDNGIGLPETHLEDIFEKPETNDVHSVTLGLHNVKQAIVALEGTIDYQSQLGEGSTFTITIPNKQ